MASPTRDTLRVEGLTPFLRATARAEKETKKQVRGALKEAGDVVKIEASSRFQRFDHKTAEGFRTRVRQTGVSVEQSLRRTTGTRPDYGALQMREALLPAMEEKSREVEDTFNDAMDKVADTFEEGPSL
jgi:hypothetical protein